MKKLPLILIATGLAILALALYRLLASGPAPESPFMSEWRMAMEAARLNGRYIPVSEEWRP